MDSKSRSAVSVGKKTMQDDGSVFRVESGNSETNRWGATYKSCTYTSYDEDYYLN